MHRYAWRSVGIGTKNCDWGKAGWEAMDGNATIVEMMQVRTIEFGQCGGSSIRTASLGVMCTQNASREARELETFAADEADFWPLTAIDPSDALWAAWQLHRPAIGDGYVMYFRRSQNQTATFAVPWVGVLPTAKYHLSYRYGYVAEAEDSPQVEGAALLAGLKVTLPQPASSLLVRYTQVAHATIA